MIKDPFEDMDTGTKKNTTSSVYDPFEDMDYKPTEKQKVKEPEKKTITQKADVVVKPAAKKTASILGKIGSVINPPMEKSGPEITESIYQKSLRKPIEGIGTKALEIASAPGYGVANTFYQALVNKDYNAAKSFWNGLTLKDKKSVGNILSKKFGVPETTTGKLVQGGIGFIGDIITDPLSYLGVGIATKAGKGKTLLKAGAEAERMAKAERASAIISGTKELPQDAKTVLTAKLPFIKEVAIPGSQFIADPIARGANTIGLLAKQGLLAKPLDVLGTSFNREYRPSTVDPVLWQKFLKGVENAEAYENLIKENAKDAAIKIKQSFKKEGITDQDLAKIAHEIERPQDIDMADGLQMTIKSHGGAIAASQARELGNIYKNIGPTGKAVIGESGYDYLPHIKEDLPERKQIGMSGRLFTTKTPSDKNRNYLRFTEDGKDYTINQLSGNIYSEGKKIKTLSSDALKQVREDATAGNLRQGTISEINKDLGINLFSTDIPKLIYIQGQRVGKAAGSDKLFHEARKFGVVDEVLAEKKGLVPVKAPELEGHFYDPEVAKRIDERYNDTIKITEDPVVGMQFVDSVKSIFDKINSEWKELATVVNIPFHTTNLISSMWQNMNRGLEPFSKAYADGMKIARAISKRESLPGELGQYIKEMKENNVIRTGFFTGDISKSIDRELMSSFDLLKRNKNVPMNAIDVIKKTGSDAGQAIESFVRSSLYVAKRQEGYLPSDSAKIVRDTHFDYSDLTKGEKEIRKFIPFYTWNKKNLALQFENLLQRPDKATRIIKLRNNVEAMVGPDDYEPIQDENFLKQFPIYIGEKDGKRRYMMLNRLVPNLATNQAGEPLSWITKNFSPVITSIASLMTNIDIPGSVAFGRVRPVSAPGQTGEFMGQLIPKELEYGIKMIRPLMELERISGTRIDTPQKKDRWMQLIFGKNVKEYNEQDLIRWFDIKNEQEASNLNIELKNLTRQLQTYPEKEKIIMKKYDKILNLMIKSKMEQANKKMKAFENL